MRLNFDKIKFWSIIMYSFFKGYGANLSALHIPLLKTGLLNLKVGDHM